MSVTRRIVLALPMALALPLAAALMPAPAFAETKKPAAADDDDPLTLVRSIYAVESGGHEVYFSRRLKALYDAAVAKSNDIDGPVAGLDFDFSTNSQDADPGLRKTLKYAVAAKTAAAASIRVTFKNGKTPEELVYDLVNEGGKWRIDEVRSVKNEGWQLSKLYEQGAKGE
jgi:hypothetical protein